MTTWVLLRGLMREARHWGGFAQLLQRTTGAAQVVCVDFPGNGSLHVQTSCTSVAGMVEHVRAVLRTRGHEPPYRVLALSLGAMVAVAWGERHAEEIERMVLLNTSMAPFNPFHRRLRPRNYPRLLGVLLLGSVVQRERLILRLTSSRLGAEERHAILQQWLEYARDCPVSRANMLRQLVAAARFRATLSRPLVPVLLLAGEQDHLVDPQCSYTLADAWRCELHVHPEAGHDLALDDGDWVAQQVRAWQG